MESLRRHSRGAEEGARMISCRQFMVLRVYRVQLEQRCLLALTLLREQG
jgi:hypothetical protein